ncbi:helix-turn-helix domain-containing protein [Methylobacterium soli]|uniref:Helix-turn-helix transcriptional regulator n=1 Tax=Methylobacterium soli TaxID=553447 RepID=A0A6L3SU02_9HYPH|nr:helix-turn-helix domain-containing protein [Methylobacterium soli]KAB1072880.1 helix-turn-helix transcriptional regulator [Methylobacterium soli]GJE41345.1 hypothetical protein AEGHOMDF_0509 [Methylobacterium soli]
MHSSYAQKLSEPETIALRRLGGRFIKELREDRGFSQATFMKAVGYSIKQYISQIETGRARIAPDQMRNWADVLRVNHRDFALMMMRFYDPETFAMIFEKDPEIFSGAAIPEFEKLLALSEAGLVEADADAERKAARLAAADREPAPDKPPARRRIGPEIEAAIRAAKAENPRLGMHKIAKSLGVGTSTVQRILGAS